MFKPISKATQHDFPAGSTVQIIDTEIDPVAPEDTVFTLTSWTDSLKSSYFVVRDQNGDYTKYVVGDPLLEWCYIRNQDTHPLRKLSELTPEMAPVGSRLYIYNSNSGISDLVTVSSWTDISLEEALHELCVRVTSDNNGHTVAYYASDSTPDYYLFSLVDDGDRPVRVEPSYVVPEGFRPVKDVTEAQAKRSVDWVVLSFSGESCQASLETIYWDDDKGAPAFWDEDEVSVLSDYEHTFCRVAQVAVLLEDVTPHLAPAVSQVRVTREDGSIYSGVVLSVTDSLLVVSTDDETLQDRDVWFTSPEDDSAIVEVLARPEKSEHQSEGEPVSDIFDEARALIGGDRQDDYGDAAESFKRIGDLWGTYLGVEVSPRDVALLMILMKVSRTKTSPGKRDNWLDILGYGGIGAVLGGDGE